MFPPLPTGKGNPHAIQALPCSRRIRRTRRGPRRSRRRLGVGQGIDQQAQHHHRVHQLRGAGDRFEHLVRRAHQGRLHGDSLLDFLNAGKTPPAGDNIATAIPADQKALASSGVTVLPASKALDTNVFAVTKSTAKKDHLTTISSLKPYAKKLTLGGPPECPSNAGCELGLKKVYGLTFAGFKSLDEAGPLSVAALKNGEVQVVELFSSDGNVVSNNFVALTDNKHLEGADYIVPVIRKSVDTPGVAKILNAIDAKLTTVAISKLNIDVTTKQEQPPAVAQAWVTSVGG
jgi:osmoprotectant transport system substrate-binding protein